MDSLEWYNQWIESEHIDIDTKNELESIKGDISDIEDRFGRELEFGTGGVRGVIGAGTNRFNWYTVIRVSQGLANFININELDSSVRSIAIAYDSRFKSKEFAYLAARVFISNNIKAYIFDDIRPTPLLSFAIRHLKASAGIVITASHNPKEYNGYKVYGKDGSQIATSVTEKLVDEISKIPLIPNKRFEVIEAGKESEFLYDIGKEIDDEYIKNIRGFSLIRRENSVMLKNIKIVYTPLHGAGVKLVPRILNEIGIKNVFIVKEQEAPDSEFSTVRVPNPEDTEAFKLALCVAEKENADIILATDPDSDRVGVMAKNIDGKYEYLTGNQIGCLLLEYILSNKKNCDSLPGNGFVVKTIVSSEMAKLIAQEYNIEMIEVLTGFKFIGEKIMELQDSGEKQFVFGFEESNGYLMGSFARDKDGVLASMLISEMAACYKSIGKTLFDELNRLYEKYGYFKEELISISVSSNLKLKLGVSLNDIIREKGYNVFTKIEYVEVNDYQSSVKIIFDGKIETINSVPKSDVLLYRLINNAWFCVRPSGTEPKIKVYFGVCAETKLLSEKMLRGLKQNIMEQIGNLLGQN